VAAAGSLAGLPVSLVGRTLRVPGADPATVQRLLGDAGVPAEVATVRASFEETFVALAGDRPQSSQSTGSAGT
jgi:hypothetical protein